MITLEKARKLRQVIVRLSAELSDTEAFDVAELFPAWALKDYAVGDRVQYEGNLYKCIQAHTAQSDWTPDTAVSLWVKVDDPSIEWPEWHQPQGAHDAYAMGDKVSHNGKHWISTADANIWEPGVFGWTEA